MMSAVGDEADQLVFGKHRGDQGHVRAVGDLDRKRFLDLPGKGVVNETGYPLPNID